MRRQFEGGENYQAAGVPNDFATGWLRAGFFSFAYRLAHLRLSHSMTLFALASLFYFL